ncbi:MAG: hypothetical protein HC854_14570 [Flavobacterium sp.]|nr:hypothetical protein [Flavobacterium sp.]
MLLEPLGIPFEERKPKLYVSEVEKQQALNTLNNIGLQKEDKIVMISALGSGLSKTYPLEFMAKVLDTICKNTNASLLFNYIPNQKEDVLKLYNLCKPETKTKLKLISMRKICVIFRYSYVL